jgi:hypothetical protein
MDRIITGLIEAHAVSESEVEGVHADMLDDEICAAMGSARSIVATNVVDPPSP